MRNTPSRPPRGGPGSGGKIGRALRVACLSLLALAPLRAAAQSFHVPEPSPAAVSRAPVELSPEEERRYLTDWRRAARPSFYAPFVRWSFGGQAYFREGQDAGAFAFDVEAGGRVVLEPGARRGVALVPTIGYGFTAGDLSSHLVTLGIGLGYEGLSFSMTYYARFASGAVNDEAAVGLRHGAVMELGNILGLSLSHEVLSIEGRPDPLHGMRVMATLDFTPLFMDPDEYFDD